MSKDADRVIAGFTRLSPEDQTVVIQQVNEYLKKDYSGRKTIRESYEKRAGLDLGPLNQRGCPCCGR
ncbi:MAG: hypothetical protein A4E69_02923 [Syntrophus sp. PtaB.Bin138]|nr:MAG: hypothetical protein A4E69_02923 [Syntrophus sp. PtaB.Bin138]